jgi:voltage-gated potassium channel
MALGFAGLFVLAEPGVHSLVDGLWWAVVTLTTVGYGDIYPTTPLGRFLSLGLMLVGIGFVAVLTAAIAAHFVEEEETHDVRAEFQRIHERLDRIERLLGGRPRSDD